MISLRNWPGYPILPSAIDVSGGFSNPQMGITLEDEGVIRLILRFYQNRGNSWDFSFTRHELERFYSPEGRGKDDRISLRKLINKRFLERLDDRSIYITHEFVVYCWGVSPKRPPMVATEAPQEGEAKTESKS